MEFINGSRYNEVKEFSFMISEKYTENLIRVDSVTIFIIISS